MSAPRCGNAATRRVRPARGIVALGLAAVAASHCASFVHHTEKLTPGSATEVVDIVSEPAGAQVFLAGTLVGTTPAHVVLFRKPASQVLRIVKDGYVPLDVPLKRTVGGAVAGNLAWALLPLNPLNGMSDKPLSPGQQIAFAFAFPVAGMAIDFMTGSAYELPRSVRVVLQRTP